MQTEENVLSAPVVVVKSAHHTHHSEKIQPEQINSLVCRFGGPNSDAILDPVFRTFSIPCVDGLIGYRIACGCTVAFGDPVCSRADLPELTAAFHAFCQDEGYKVIYITTGADFSEWALKNGCQTLIEWGTEIVIDPVNSAWSKKSSESKILQRKVRQAQEENLVVKEYLIEEASLVKEASIEEIEQEIQQVATAWLKARRGLQIYLSCVALFDNKAGKRWFYGVQNNRVVGVIMLNELQASGGWHISNLMTTPEAPQGTHEMLITSVIDALQSEGCHYLSAGTVPMGKLGRIEGLGPRTQQAINFVFKFLTTILRLNGKLQFWKKFSPDYRPSYLLFSRPSVGIKEICALMRAMNLGL